MFKRLLVLLLILTCTSSVHYGQSPVTGWCEQGNNTVSTVGLTSTTKVQRSFPSCTITVLDAGTVTLSTIYSDAVGTPLANPFTASATGYYSFYANNGTYDIRQSGGGILTPFIEKTAKISDAAAGIGGTGTATRIPKFTAGATIANSQITDNSISIGINNTSPVATALLDLTSTTQGLLPPRMTTIQRDAIVSPATGLLIYNTTTNAVNVFSGTWGVVGGGISTLNGLSGSSQTFVVGTSGTDFAITSVGTTHTFNIPDASASARGLITTGAQTLAGAKSFTSTVTLPVSGVALGADYSNLTNYISLGSNVPDRGGINHGTTGTPVTGATTQPSFSIQRKDATTNAAGTTMTLMVAMEAVGGTTFRRDAIAGYAYGNTPTSGDYVGMAGLSQVTGTAGGAGNAFGLFGEGTLTNIFGLGQAQGAEIDVVNNTGLTAPFTTNSLPTGATLGLAIGGYKVGGGSENVTAGIVFQGSTQFNHAIFFPNTSLDNTSYGLDFRFLNNSHFTTGSPIAFSNDIYLTGEEAGGTQRNIIGINTSNQIMIGTANNVAQFGSSIRPGVGSFVANTAQIYTTATQGLIITGVAGSSYDFLLAESGGNALLRNVAGTNNLEIALQGNVVVGGNNGALAVGATSGFLYLPTMTGAPTGIPELNIGYSPLVYDTTNDNFRINNGGAGLWKTFNAVEPARIIDGTGTGLTVNESGRFERAVHKVTVTFAALSCAALTCDKTIATIPAKTRLVGIIADTTQVYAGGTVSAASIIVGKTVGGNEYLLTHSVFGATIVRGLVDGDLGASLARATAVQTGDLPSWTTTTNVSVRLTTVTANTNALTQGSTTYYLITEKHP